MKLQTKAFISIFISILLAGLGIAFQEDVEGSKDHPLLSRMQNYYISGFEETENDSYEFYDDKDNEYLIEGHKWVISYTIREGFEPPGQLKVRQNYVNAIRKIGGTILDERRLYIKVTRGTKETWIYIWVSPDGRDYELTIVERPAMKQEITAGPEAMAGDLMTTGHVSIYGIYFGLDSHKIKPESEPTLKAIADMLKADSSLRLYVVGHTEMTGGLESGIQLSEKRAEAVVSALVNGYGIEASRLKAIGVGPFCPVSTNQTEEGRKLNRRIELVKMEPDSLI
jgi:outer membrane protein OmpA-like peptidoglycan-associated protein